MTSLPLRSDLAKTRKRPLTFVSLGLLSELGEVHRVLSGRGRHLRMEGGSYEIKIGARLEREGIEGKSIFGIIEKDD